MRIATWNLNNRVGRMPFRPEAAEAAVALDADIVVFTEFYPQGHESKFRATLAAAGWSEQLMSTPTDAVANRVLIASKVTMEPSPLALPAFDAQFPANVCAVLLPTIGLTVVGVRVPAYSGPEQPLLTSAWDWIKAAAFSLKGTHAVILGDLNVSTDSSASRGGAHFRRILSDGWRRAAPPGGATFFRPQRPEDRD